MMEEKEDQFLKINPSTSRLEGRGLLRVDPEPRFFTPSSKAGLGAVERVNPEEKKKEVDLNLLFPGKEYDLNRLFPDEGTKKLLYELKRNKRDIERFIRNLDFEGGGK